MTTTHPRVDGPGPTSAETHGYISDMLNELAGMARGCGDLRLEGAMRILALDAAAQSVRRPEASTATTHSITSRS